MNNKMKRGLSLLLVCALLVSMAVTAFAATDGIYDMFALEGADVTVDGTEDKTVSVYIKNTGYEKGAFTALEGTFTTAAAEGTITLQSITSPNNALTLEMLGESTVILEEGKFAFCDLTLATKITLDQKLICATYKIDKDTPTGTYTVKYTNITIGDNEWDGYTEGREYLATITVTNTNCHHENAAKTDEVAATCTEPGTAAYWTCPDCEKMFSDEKCTAEITKAAVIPALGHDYDDDGICTRCKAVKPAIELFLDVIPNDNDCNGYGEVNADATFTVTLNARSAADAVLDGFSAQISYDSDHLTLDKVEYITGVTKNNNVLFGNDVNVSLTADEPSVLATYTFTVKEGAQNGEQYDIAILNNNFLDATLNNNAESLTPNTDASDKGVEIASTTLTFLKEDGSVLETINQPVGTAVTAPEAPEKAGYDFIGWDSNDDNTADTVPSVMPADDMTFKPLYEAQEHTITLDPDNGGDLTVITGKTDENYNEPEAPEKTGYDFAGWDTNDDGEADELPSVIPAEDLTAEAVWTAKEYTVTYAANGGADVTAAKYTIEDAITLADAPAYEGFTFAGWKVTAADGNWTADEVYGAKAVIAAGKYGNVTLTAQWNIEASFKFEDYAYAKSNQVLLIVDAAKLDSGCYLFDGEPLYWTDSNDYGEDGAYVTLVDYETYGELSNMELGKLLTVGTAETVTIARDGDVNGDGKVNNTDATIVYQMLVKNADYYQSLTVLDRLECDMVTATANATYRGSIADVNAIVSIIFG